MVKGIPTRYSNVNFRSRLEATWARFFDLCQWEWGYEPIDLDGWIPDFALYGKEEIVMVEVKPVIMFPENIAQKIERSGCSKDVLILGEKTPISILENWLPDHPILGWLGQYFDGEEGEFSWGPAVYGRWNDGGGKLGFCHSIQSFYDRISGGYDGGCFGALKSPTPEEISALWREAGNSTRWKR